MQDLQEFQRLDKYARFNDVEGRRETWSETVNRTVSHLRKTSNNILDNQIYNDIYNAIYSQDVMPSMRLLAMAGPAAERSSLTLYNCAAVAVDSIDSFVEALILSMSGCGVGFSVEHQFVDQLPVIEAQNDDHVTPTYTIADSAEGWADALRFGLERWFSGYDVIFNYEGIRPAGTPLKTKGGQASGPEPLKTCLDAIRGILLYRQGKRLRPIDAYDSMCLIASCAISGGVRRSAMLCLFDAEDQEMLHAKDWPCPSHRWNANNSAVWTDGTTDDDIRQQFKDMFNSDNGEPGFFNRPGVYSQLPKRRDPKFVALTNPCAEVILRPQELCNLSSVICRSSDSFFDLERKVRLATIIGTIQSMETNFPGMRPVWKENCEKERLLGVDLNGQMDVPHLFTEQSLHELKEIVLETNIIFADILGINHSAGATCVKPNGNSSVLNDCAPGIHARQAHYYIRNARIGAKSPIYKVLRDQGVPMDPENGQEADTADTWVIHWPIKAPEGAVVTSDQTAITQLDYWKLVKKNWAEHSVSCTVTYRPEELSAVTEWIVANRKDLSGLSFMPDKGAVYNQMPYEPITKEEYEKNVATFPKIDWSVLADHEKYDMTTAAQEVSCSAGGCLV